MPKVTQREGVTITSNVGDVGQVVDGDPEEATVIGAVRKTKVSTEGIQVDDTSQSALKATGQFEKAVGPYQGSEPAPIQVEPPSAIINDTPVRTRIARYIKPDFPDDWDFSGKMKDRMKRLKTLGTDPLTLEAIYAAEGDNFRRALEKEFPNQFKSD
jgi:hypothetical protein